jgi:hypothetical protein
MPDAPLEPLNKQEILASDISQFAEWWLSVYCARCQMVREFLPGQLLKHAGKLGAVAEVIARLRCRRCGDPPEYVTVFNQPSFGNRSGTGGRGCAGRE